MVDFKPSQVVLHPVPLVATFERTENEVSAAVLVMTLAQAGDTWRPVAPREVGEMLRAQPKGAPILTTLMVVRFAFDVIEAKGWVTKHADNSLEFTQAGLERLRRWVRT